MATTINCTLCNVICRVLELSGDVTPDVATLNASPILIATPEKWDGVTRLERLLYTFIISNCDWWLDSFLLTFKNVRCVLLRILSLIFFQIMVNSWVCSQRRSGYHRWDPSIRSWERKCTRSYCDEVCALFRRLVGTDEYRTLTVTM